MGLWHFYVSHDGIKDVVAWFTGGILTVIVARPFWTRSRRRQDHIIDLLRTDTPGGLAEVAEAIRDSQPVDFDPRAGHRGPHGK